MTYKQENVFKMKTFEFQCGQTARAKFTLYFICILAFTRQYGDFNALLDSYPKLRIIAFPCNQFSHQEPAENHELLNGLFLKR